MREGSRGTRVSASIVASFPPLGSDVPCQCSDLHVHPLHALRALQQSVDSCVLSTSYLVLASVLTCLMLIRFLHKASGKQPST